MSYASNLLCIAAVYAGFFTPGGQFLQFLIGHSSMWPLLQEESQILFNVQTMRLGHFNHRVDGSAGMSAAGNVTEQPVAATDGQRTYTVLDLLCEYSDNQAYPNKSLIRSFLHQSL